MTTTMIRKQESKEFDFPKFSAGPGSVVIRPARGTGSVGVFAMAPNADLLYEEAGYEKLN